MELGSLDYSKANKDMFILCIVMGLVGKKWPDKQREISLRGRGITFVEAHSH